MTVRSIQNFEHALHTANEWLKELNDHPEVRSERDAHSILRTVLHALRDQLSVEESAHLSAQLPMLIRGLYFDGWRPSIVPHRMPEAEFMQKLHQKLSDKKGVRLAPEQALSLVFALLESRVGWGEIGHVKGSLPTYLRNLFPD